MPIESHIDDDYMATGTHKGANSALVIWNPGADFMSCGINGDIGQAVYNDTQSTNGNVSASTEDTCTTDISWDKGDTYYIYKTDTKNSAISSIGIESRYGRKVTDKTLLDEDGLLAEDRDLDEDIDDIIEGRPFGPGQPKRY